MLWMFFQKVYLLSLRLMLECQMKNCSAVMYLSIFWPGPWIKSQENELDVSILHEKRKTKRKASLISFVKEHTKMLRRKVNLSIFARKNKRLNDNFRFFSWNMKHMCFNNKNKKAGKKAPTQGESFNTSDRRRNRGMGYWVARVQGVCVSWLFLVLVEGVHLVFFAK